MGLRERKKLATRRALHRVAVDLAIDRGLENVTVDDIAAAADVSARTFFNYFSSKEDALIGDGPPRPTAEAREDFVDGGPTGDLVDDLRILLFSPFESGEESAPIIEEMHKLRRLIELEPQLVPRMKAAFVAGEQQLSEVVAARLGDTPEDIRPHLVAEVGLTAMRFALRRLWGAIGSPTERTTSDIRAMFDQTFTVLKATFQPAE